MRDAGLLWVEAELAGAPDEHLVVECYDGAVGDVLRGWLARVGAPTELPPWVFRLWASCSEWNTQEPVLAEIARHRQGDVPVGVVVI